MRVYVYEVTSSVVGHVPVGHVLVDRVHPEEDDPIRSWHLWNSNTGEFYKGWTAERQDRACRVCYERPYRSVRPHDHDGEHGKDGGPGIVPRKFRDDPRAAAGIPVGQPS